MSQYSRPAGLPEILLGKMDYYLKPSLKRKQGGPFNGQEFRQRIFLQLLDKMAFSVIVETGTYRGVTTQYMYEMSGFPVHTTEVNPRFFSYAKSRLRRHAGISLSNMDSREFLAKLIRERALEGQSAFFYLDAHWGEDLPLLEEVQLIFNELPTAVVMVDDFKVPWDDFYGYDDYGDGKSLDLGYLGPAIEKYGLSAFFPVLSGDRETGVPRGCVILSRSPETTMLLGEMTTLRAFRNDA